MRANLTAIRQRVERLAHTTSARGDVSTWSDERLHELLAFYQQLDSCPRCGSDLANCTTAVLQAGVHDPFPSPAAAAAFCYWQVIDCDSLDVCPTCGDSILGMLTADRT